MFSPLPSVLIDHYYCFKVERCNYIDYIMRCLSITTHSYACENCLVNQMLTLIMTCLRTNLMSNDLARGNAYLILHIWTTLYAFLVCRIKGRKVILLHGIGILFLMIIHHALLLCIVQIPYMISVLDNLTCSSWNKHSFKSIGRNKTNILNPTKNVLVISDNHWNLTLLNQSYIMIITSLVTTWSYLKPLL